MIYKALYEWGAGQLKAAGIGEAALDARLLLQDICATYISYHPDKGYEPVAEEKCME